MPPDQNALGSYLRSRRTRLDPAALGFAVGRRRTLGLRREEVAQRANISPTWYTWLEQGRGGAPSAAVLDRIAKGLMLTEPEREHLFMLGLGRPPEVRYTPADGISPRLQRVLDAMPLSPAIIKTATWDVVGWNKAAAALLTDYSKLPREQRNILRLLFGNARKRARQEDWSSVARFVVGAFRADVPAPAPPVLRRSPGWWMSCAGSAPNSPRCGRTTTSSRMAKASSASNTQRPVVWTWSSRPSRSRGAPSSA